MNDMKKELLVRLFVLISLVVFAGNVFANDYDFEVDGIYYKISSDTEVCVTNPSLTSSSNSDYQHVYEGTCIIPTSVTYENKSFNVTSIDNYAFYSQFGLTSITIPSTITSIGNSAFYGCHGLTTIEIPNSVTSISDCVFEYCSNLVKVVLSKQLKAIPFYSFGYCSQLSEITIPGSVVRIDGGAFRGCLNLKQIDIPSSVNNIVSGAFQDCESLQSISIPPNASLGVCILEGCKSLENVYSEIADESKIISVSLNDFPFLGMLSTPILHVPQGTKEIYEKSPKWSKYFSSIIDDLDNPYAHSLSITCIGNGTASYGGETIRSSVKSYSVSEGTSVTVNFNPDTGYRIKSLKVNGSSVPATNSYSVTINSDTTIEVEFEEIPDTPTVTTYTLSITASGNGSANYGGESIRGTSRSYSLNEGSSVSISFTPDEGFRIESVKVNGSNMGNESSYSTTINANTTVEVVFEAIPVTTYSLTVTASGNGIATFDGKDVRGGSQIFTVNEGSDAIVAFTPEKGYKVEVVKVDGNEVEVAESYTISDITSDKIVEVAFAEMDRNFSIDGVSYLIESFEDNTVTLNGVQNTITLEVSDKINYQAQEWNVIGISENALENSEELAAIIWNTQIPFTAKVSNPNLLLYVKDEANAPAGIRNVVVNGFAKTITLTDAQSGNNFYCPIAFTTQSIIYTHNYSMKTGINESKGWETIALPFDVQQISHSGKGEIIPFAKWNADDDTKPFWLYELTGTGYVEAEELKANTPYIISMPNNDQYPNDYQLSGRVTFSALNAEVKKSDDIQTTTFGNNTFVPAFTNHKAESGCYALNVNNDFETYQGSANVGSKFILNLRRIHPFEAYMTSTSDTRSIEIFDSMTTGIRDVLDITDSQKTNKVYDLSGRLIAIGISLESIRQELPAGVYIINNKKMIIK